MADEQKRDQKFEWWQQVIQPDADRKTVVEIYDNWAETYEKDLDEVSGKRRRYIVEIAKDLSGSDGNVRILDAGSASGNIGQWLYDEGFRNLDALDPSPKMLAVAKRRNIFKRLICDYLGPNRLDVEDGIYDIIMCIGALISTHVKDDAFEEMIRITKPGGYIVFAVSAVSLGKSKEPVEKTMQTMHDQSKWVWQDKRTIQDYVQESLTNDEMANIGYMYVFKTPKA